MPLDESTFLSELREPKPDPGGGSASAFASIVALALAEKICLLEILRAEKARKGHEDIDERLQKIVGLADGFRELAAKDVMVYENLSHEIKAGKRWPENTGAIQGSIDCPRDMLLSAIQALALIGDQGLNCSQSLTPDLLVALEIMSGSARAAFHIAISNTTLIEEDHIRMSRIAELKSLAGEVEAKHLEFLENLRRK
jgi:formiminotetrahydrofolate cyclodeaminase